MQGADGSRVAIIGSGISGLAAAWLMQKSGWKVTLYEAEDYFGGHTLTDETIPGVPVDLGFQVFNRTTYGHFEQFLEALGVDSEESDMSFALSVDDGKVEWGSHNLSTIFAQRRNLVSPKFLLMIRDVLRFGKEAPKVLVEEQYADMTLGEYLKKEGYSEGFTYWYLLPMCAAVWSVSNKQCMEFSIRVMIRFWVNHHLLELIERPKWRVVKDRSRSYVRKVVEILQDARSSCAVRSVVRKGDKVEVRDEQGKCEEFDHVIFATHSDVTMKILGGDISKEEEAILKGIPYAENDVYLHRDPSLMPRERKVWASWNCLDMTELNKDAPSDRAVCVSYWVNSLQRLPEGTGDLFVTLNPPHAPAEEKTVKHLKLSHPVFSGASKKSQETLDKIQGVKRTWFCGAWCGYGFHEDGMKSAVNVVEKMGGMIPWVPRPTSPYMPLLTRFVCSSVHRFAGRAIKRGSLRLIMPNGTEVVYGNPEQKYVEEEGGDEKKGRREVYHSRVRVFDCKFFHRIAKDTDIGLGESYMNGEFEPDDLTNFLNVLTQNVEEFNSLQKSLGVLNWIGTQVQTMAHMARANTVEGSLKNINEHYDLGNDMYRLFLDETWMYSSGVFNSPQDTLYQSQLNKLDLILDKLELNSGHHIFEIGCGWGGFAIRAVERFGCRVTGITISEEQFSYATAKVEERGMSDRITILFCDYRKLPAELLGKFDRLVSIEMIEAVGHENLGEYFGVIEQLLVPGGKAVIQAITYKDEHYMEYCRCSDFIRRHIFPGGHLPSMGAMLGATRNSSLFCQHVEDIGLHYARTLKMWHENWTGAEDKIKKLGYSDEFYRKWRFYFSYCEAGFQLQFIHNYQIVWCKSPVSLARTSRAAASSSSPFSFSALDTNTMSMVWCFVAGFAGGKYINTLWLVPIMSVLFLLLSLSCGFFSSMAAGRIYTDLDDAKQRQWARSVVSGVYSLLTVLLLLVGFFVSSFSNPFRSDAGQVCNLLLSMTCGFSIWSLFDGIKNRANVRSSARSGVAGSTIALCCGVICLAKQLLVPYICLTLLSEVHSLLMHALDIAQLALLSSPLLEKLHWGSLGLFRIAGHALLTVKVYSDRGSFPNSLLFLVALSGMLVLNGLNLRLLVDLVLHPIGHRLARSAPPETARKVKNE
ncbi:hypothetical protein GUITHDRAFT_165417 [Guillardia theta CCMP2712]|uniref:Amine oxidase domain-containing protein n=1 Tax=Guillardia theta (strain CCMP2712) TaxID=905079 RepID=L1IP77_GUITC|nr:hypothetical protein GUITHDRAFT_165417 [Guillardia theta CCMP2712]EKX37689.1 hypothetical protein GUITHDRAFT_165417 [Guillardia theta CCMP2712]|eukprot:XP_005824669.1 hypothetical protein GUITHDRAFT_165417 [Guillardia theta CCMP2712]